MWVLDALQDGGSGRDTDDLPGGAEQPENSRHGGNVGVWGGRPGQIIFQVSHDGLTHVERKPSKRQMRCLGCSRLCKAN